MENQLLKKIGDNRNLGKSDPFSSVAGMVVVRSSNVVFLNRKRTPQELKSISLSLQNNGKLLK